MNADVSYQKQNALYAKVVEDWCQKVAGDMLLPTMSTGTPEIPDSVYAEQKKLWDKSLEEGNSYVDLVMSVGEGKK